MVKVKKNVGRKIIPKQKQNVAPQTDSDEEISGAESDKEDGYDSMIENGTSEDSEDDVKESKDVYEHNKHSSKTCTKRKSVAGEAPAKLETPFKKSKGNVEKVKPPTIEEINELKETRNLFHSNLFRLQIKEMLAELKVKQKYTNYINQWLEEFKTFLAELKTEKEKQDIDQLHWLIKSPLQVPLALKHLKIDSKQKSLQFQFIKPNVPPFLIGAAATGSLLGPKLVADVCVLMPVEFFQKDNYLNLAYEQKRALYLTYIADKMLTFKSKLFNSNALNLEQLCFNYYANNPLKPILEFTPPNEKAHKLCIRIFVAAEEKCFKLSRFVPWNNNIRANVFDINENNSLTVGTPHYNANVLFDLTMQRNVDLLRQVFAERKNFQDGLILLKVWLQQRQLNEGYSGFHAHVLALFMAHLLQSRRLHANMSSYQVARAVWNELAFSTWDENSKGISLCASEEMTPNLPTLEQFHSHFDVVFVDVTGFHNICAQLSLEIYKRVRMEAKLAVDMLNDMKLNSFQHIFMIKHSLHTQFDHILKINKADAIEQILELHVPPALKYDFACYTYPLLLQVVNSLLQKGLGKRVQALLPIEQVTTPWHCQESPPNCPEQLHLGIVLNPEHAFEVLDKGPESIAAEAADFRKFWGDKAQLRRFQDGSITESVVWASTTDTLFEKRLIVRSIVLHLLQHHFQLEADDLDYVAGEFDISFKLTRAFKTERLKVPQDTDSEALTLPLIHTFDSLTRQLHGLTELPLEIVSIAGISPVFRYCDPEPLLPKARYINEQLYATDVQRGVVQLGLSGKWPSELPALRALKTAFYIQIAKLLREKHHLQTKVTYDGVLVLKQGYCFAFEIAHPKEVALLKKETSERGITQYVDSAASIALEKRLYILPKITGALHALYQTKPSFGGTVMIAKRWLYSQLLDAGLWPDECTELLIASQFLRTQDALTTSSPQTGFIRFLHLLAHTDWKTELVLLNFSNAMDEKEVSDLEQRFNTARDTFPPLCIITSYDLKHYGKLWSSDAQPNVHVLARVTILARQALAIIEPALSSTSAGFINPAKIFTASNQGYDLVIQLKPDLVPNTLAVPFASPFVPLGKPSWRLPLAGTNYLQTAVQKLREAYADFAAFFYNPCGGKEIAVIWKPNAFAAREFKVNEVNGSGLVPAGNRVQCQKEVLIEDFKFILKDFSLHIDTVEAVQRVAQEKASKFKKGRNDITDKSAKRYFENIKDAVQTNSGQISHTKQISTNSTKIKKGLSKTKVNTIKSSKLKTRAKKEVLTKFVAKNKTKSKIKTPAL